MDTHYFWRGRVHQDLEDYEKAVVDFSRAIELNPADAFNFQSRGVNYAYLKDYAAAIADYTGALELMPDNAGHLYLRAQAYFEWGKYAEAIVDYSRAIELTPDHKNYYEIRGFAHHRLGQYQQALADFQRCVELQPTNTLCYYWRAVVRLNLAQYEDAIEDMNQSEILEPDDAISRAYCAFWRAIAYFRLQKPAEVKTQLEAARKALADVDEVNQHWRIQGILDLFDGDETAARSAYQQVLDDDKRATKLFSPRLYLLQLSRLFPERQGYTTFYEWFESQVD
jgi:tetratricopeptide (TPR) repeat protein